MEEARVGGWGEHDSSGEHCRPSPWENAKMGSGMGSTLHKAWLTASSLPSPEIRLTQSPSPPIRSAWAF